jgi:hypothetical protein
MRMAKVFAVTCGVGFLALMPLAGCFDSVNDCFLNGVCFNGRLMSGSAGGGGMIDPMCVPSENASPVGENCGVFVSSSRGDDGHAGTPSAPVKTLARAVEVATATAKPVYACAEAFAEEVTLPVGSVLYGGLDCANEWRYVGATMKTSLAPEADVAAVSQITLVLSGGVAKTRIEDIAVTAPDATLAGGSSIAALVDGGSAEFVRCELTAGNGMPGATGETPSESVGPSDSNNLAIRGKDGAAACQGDANGNPGGAGAANMVCMTAVGGTGGVGKETLGEAGTDGQPVPNPNPDGWGLGGAGAGAAQCKRGDDGLLGADGASGVGASTSTPGMLSSAGFVGAEGVAGTDGTPGQGGGGGGGAKGKAGCNGASGGGGGAGGCGGRGGRGGQGGGPSIALASVGANVLLQDVKLLTGNGGDGGEGGEGQNGAIGGFGGGGGLGTSGTLAACAGGQGGQGGFGGKGGGGRGGPSVGIAFTGPAPVREGGSIKLGTPGKGGTGADAAGMGADGAAAETMEMSASN